MVNANNIKYYPITLKLCKSILKYLLLKPSAPLLAVYSEAIMLWVSPDYPRHRDQWGSPETTWSGREMPGQHLDAPFPVAAPATIWLQLQDRPWATPARPSLSWIPDPSKTTRGFWVYRADDQMLNRDEFIKLVVLTNMASWPHERTCLLFFLPDFMPKPFPQQNGKWRNLIADSAESAQLASFIQR